MGWPRAAPPAPRARGGRGADAPPGPRQPREPRSGPAACAAWAARPPRAPLSATDGVRAESDRGLPFGAGRLPVGVAAGVPGRCAGARAAAGSDEPYSLQPAAPGSSGAGGSRPSWTKVPRALRIRTCWRLRRPRRRRRPRAARSCSRQSSPAQLREPQSWPARVPGRAPWPAGNGFERRRLGPAASVFVRGSKVLRMT